ncbi:hypothetical protein [Rhodococcus kronopolitis]|uniref:Transmembrane protein n=1 Tax=Rhodococcus kronopolitis TaxID=1460226 RepID=A0ABV9FYS7_9NOCA
MHGRLSLTLRLLRPPPGSVARGSDRLEAALMVGLAVLAVVLVPLACWLGARTGEQQVALAQQQARELRTTTATTVDAADHEAAVDPGIRAVDVVTATWTWAGEVHRGRVVADAGAPAGTHVDIWVDSEGNRSAPPIPVADAATAGPSVAVFTWVSAMMLAGTGVAIGTGVLNRRRDEQWTRALAGLLGDAPAR